MNQIFLSKNLWALVAIGLASLLLANGCGGASAEGITVQTGSLSKSEFIERSGTICKAFRAQFLKGYGSFLEKTGVEGSPAEEETWLREIVEEILLPNYEDGIERISALGAPESYEPEVTTFLNALQHRLDEMEEDPAKLSSSATPFIKVGRIAKSDGLTGCAYILGAG